MDILQREGRYVLPPGVSPILGVEFSGIISDIGPEVTGWSVGDQVLGLAGGVITPRNSHNLSHNDCCHTGRLCGVHRRSLDTCHQEASFPVLGASC